MKKNEAYRYFGDDRHRHRFRDRLHPVGNGLLRGAPVGSASRSASSGMWFIAGTVIYHPQTGCGAVGGNCRVSGEFLWGRHGGLTVLLSGVVQGLFAELVFKAFLPQTF